MFNIGVISLSNGLSIENSNLIDELCENLTKFNINVFKSSVIYKNKDNITLAAKLRAKELMNLYLDDNIDAIFDISGGDLANEVLPYIDFELISSKNKPFFGYSDLSVILNSIYSKTSKEAFWFQLKNVVLDKTKTSLKLLVNYLLNNDLSLFNFDYKWIQGNYMDGIVIGGNLRCTLKLAGTSYMPDFKDKIIFIESLGGDLNKITTYLTQYKLMGVFDKCKGIILGTFIEYEKINIPLLEDLVISIVDNKNIPIIKTLELGHNTNSKCIKIGSYYNFK